MYTRYTDEQTKRAASADIVDLLQRNGQQVKRVGSEYEWLDGGQTVSIKGNMWFHQYDRVGGNSINFVERFFGLKFPDAVRFILNEDGSETQASVPIHKKETPKPQPLPPKEFKIPERSHSMSRVFGYLINTRGIDRDILRTFAHNGLIYESLPYHNAVFIGKDKYGNDKHAHLRSTASEHRWRGNQAGSDARYSFNWRGKGDSVFLFEAPIDMLSYITMHPENWTDNNYIAACSLSNQPIMQMLEDNPNLNHIYICFDNDRYGQKAAQELQTSLTESGYNAEILVPTLKDWNEDLLNTGQEEGEVECQAISQFL